VLGLNSR